MSVAGILSSAVFSIGSQLLQSRKHQISQEFQQLGTDLQSGNLTAAQADFAALQKMQPQPPARSSTPGSNPITQDFNQLAADLKAGNTTAAQQDFTKLQQDFQSQGTQTHHHHHHHGGSSNSGGGSEISQLFSQLGSALQSGNLSTAQQAYSAMLQQFQQYGAAGVTASQSGASALSINA